MRAILTAFLMFLTSSAIAQETRIASDGHIPPPASIEDVAWLVGEWSGPGIAGAPAHEHWFAPVAGTMIGTFVQETGKSPSDTGIMFSELMYLMEEEGSLVVRLKHFNPDLTAWEDRDKMLRFRLVAIEGCTIYFSALTYRCLKDEGGAITGMVVAVRMERDDGDEVEELVFRFKRRG